MLIQAVSTMSQKVRHPCNTLSFDGREDVFVWNLLCLCFGRCSSPQLYHTLSAQQCQPGEGRTGPRVNLRCSPTPCFARRKSCPKRSKQTQHESRYKWPWVWFTEQGVFSRGRSVYWCPLACKFGVSRHGALFSPVPMRGARTQTITTKLDAITKAVLTTGLLHFTMLKALRPKTASTGTGKRTSMTVAVLAEDLHTF